MKSRKFTAKIVSMLMCALVIMAFPISTFAASGSSTANPSSAAGTAKDNSKVVKLAFTDSPTLKVGDMTIYHPSYAAMLAFKGAFEKSTGGEYTVDLYPNGVLGDASSTIEQMLAGTLTGSTPADGTLSSFAPDIQVFTIPYLFSNPTAAYDVLDGDFGTQLFDKIAKDTRIRIIAAYDNGGYRNFTNSKRPIKTAADMKGLKIRVMESPVYIKMIEALGATATPIAFLELYSALQTGVVDGQENSAVTTLGSSLNEVQKYCTLDGHLLGLAFLTISEDWYESLDAATQAKVDEAGKEATLASRGTCRYAEALAIDTLTKKGVEVYSPNEKELETFKVCQAPVIEYLKSNLKDPSLVDELQTAIKNVNTNGTAANTSSSGNSAAASAANSSSPSGGSNTGIIIAVVAVLLIIVLFAFSRKKGKKQE
ncbi:MULTISPECIES: TRAP transporter substrate-binding protein [Acutalibacteraceae]|uniref:TRAP transporter substrate-binding protein n=1 Tax=Acutalibacteraceae TaxID=3082771 RepID=UPI0013E8F297|nr:MULTISPECIES: TRAP transporter substrate-binding protein [Acutalibacteraceae]